ncbi:hypothetical protein, partial [Bacillus thuringiensis]
FGLSYVVTHKIVHRKRAPEPGCSLERFGFMSSFIKKNLIAYRTPIICFSFCFVTHIKVRDILITVYHAVP